MTSRAASLDQRHREPELMDQPGLDAALHAHALDSLQRINHLSRTAATLWRAIRALPRSDVSTTPLTILDVASGGGDVAVAVARRAAREGIPVQITGCDISPIAVRYASLLAARHGLHNVSFFEHDVLRKPLPQQYDVVMSSLFLHHLDDAEAAQVLARFAVAARRMVLVSDLRRTRFGYFLACLVSRTVTRSPIVRVDGPLSVAAAFSEAEALRLAERSGLAGAQIVRIWPQRFLLTWRRS